MPRNRKNKRNNRNRGKSRGPRLQRAGMRMGGTGGIINSPLAVDYPRPKVRQTTRTPTRKGSEAAVNGCDFIGTYSSLASSARTIEFDLNALNALVFPRLCAIASVWKRYVFDNIVFHLFGVTGATQEGFCAMASIVTDDLATESTVGGEVEVLNMEGAAIGRPWSAVSHRVRCEAEGLKWYTSDNNPASSTTYGEAMGRAFLYLPETPEGDGKISIQVYVEYSVQFSQRVPYKLEPPVSTVLAAETLEELHKVKTEESTFNLADKDIANVLEDSLIKNLGEAAADYGRAFVGSLGQIQPYFWNKTLDIGTTETENDIIAFGTNLGKWFGLNEPFAVGINEIVKLTPLFYEFIKGKDAFPSTTMIEWLAKLVFPVIDGAATHGLDAATFQSHFKLAIDNWVPDPERLASYRERDLRGHASEDFIARVCEPTDLQISDNDLKSSRSCTHPSEIEGTKICCTRCM